MKGSSNSSIELPEAGDWGHSPQPLRDFQYFNESKLYILCKNSTLIIMHSYISASGMKLVLYLVETDSITHRHILTSVSDSYLTGIGTMNPLIKLEQLKMKTS